MRIWSQYPCWGFAPAALALWCCFHSFASATPYPRDRLHDAGYGYLLARQCKPCGADSQLCCGLNEACVTQNNVATCLAVQYSVSVSTTTWTETHVFTRTISNTYQIVTAEVTMEACVTQPGMGQTSCGPVCCGSWQTCLYEGQCIDRTTGIGGVPVPSPTTQFSAPHRPTTIPTTTTTATTTPAPAPPIAAVDNGDGLSGGAIAGIVIGVIAGVILLCTCCLVRGVWSGIMSLFGKKKDHRRREKIVVEEERYMRHGSRHSRRDRHGSWYSDRPSGAAAARKKEAKGLLGLAAGLGTLALLLGLKKRDDKPKPTRSRSSYSSSYFAESYTGSTPSSASSRRTRQTRGSRGTRATRITRSSKMSSRRSSRR